MRALVKALRLFYVGLVYYFMPFVFTFVTFATGLPLFRADFPALVNAT